MYHRYQYPRNNNAWHIGLSPKITITMYKIQANASGTRTIEISNDHLATIEKYSLFEHLVDSNGVVDEDVLEKLKLNIRSLLESDANSDKQLLDLCLDVIYHKDMKALGLKNLLALYTEKYHNATAD